MTFNRYLFIPKARYHRRLAFDSVVNVLQAFCGYFIVLLRKLNILKKDFLRKGFLEGEDV